MDTGDLHDASTVRSLDALTTLSAPPLPNIATKDGASPAAFPAPMEDAGTPWG